jgi:hypothetical protein
MPLMRDVMVGFLGLRVPSPLGSGEVAPDAFRGGGRWNSVGCECSDDEDAEGTGEGAGLEVVLGGLLVEAAAMFRTFGTSR